MSETTRFGNLSFTGLVLENDFLRKQRDSAWAELAHLRKQVDEWADCAAKRTEERNEARRQVVNLSETIVTERNQVRDHRSEQAQADLNVANRRITDQVELIQRLRDELAESNGRVRGLSDQFRMSAEDLVEMTRYRKNWEAAHGILNKAHLATKAELAALRRVGLGLDAATFAPIPAPQPDNWVRMLVEENIGLRKRVGGGWDLT